MPKIKYKDVRFAPDALRVVEAAARIVEEYQRQGFDMTLRQVYYKIIARDLFPEDRRYFWTGSRWVRDPSGSNPSSTKNNVPNYNWLGDLVSDARLAGLIDWNQIVDRTRGLQVKGHWDDPAEIIQSAAGGFALDRWEGQPYRPEVWIEKDALLGVFEGICQELDVPLLSCRGYNSQSEMWRAAQRMLRYKQQKQTPMIFHFGDHDPSGKDMSRDILDRLYLFTGKQLEFERLALNIDQVRRYDPPPSPAKITDPRAKAYIQEFGDDSWELDALEPRVIKELVREAVERIQDDILWRESGKEEAAHRETLRKISDNYQEVQTFVEEQL